MDKAGENREARIINVAYEPPARREKCLHHFSGQDHRLIDLPCMQIVESSSLSLYTETVSLKIIPTYDLISISYDDVSPLHNLQSEIPWKAAKLPYWQHQH